MQAILKYFFIPAFSVHMLFFSNPVHADAASVEKADKLIYEGIEKNREKIRELAWSLTDGERKSLILKYRRDTFLPVVLNVFLGFGIGSYFQGDLFGGLVGSVSGLTFFSSLTVGIVLASTTSDSTLSTGAGPWFITAGVSGLLYAAFEILRPIGYGNKYNRILYDVLKLKDQIAVNMIPFSRIEPYTRNIDEGAVLAFTTSF